MKKPWKLLLGASLLTGVAGSFLLKRKNQALPHETSLALLYQCYTGEWFFINKQESTRHTLVIDAQLTIHIDGKKIPYTLIELTTHRLVAQDEYGYHLIIQCLNRKPASLYDEADDISYPLNIISDQS